MNDAHERIIPSHRVEGEDNMKTVILCGGKGRRLDQETEFKPKPLVEIGGKPILWHIMKIYSHQGFKGSHLVEKLSGTLQT
jgi:NDP-sugar pyrophosphorylase family protein